MPKHSPVVWSNRRNLGPRFLAGWSLAPESEWRYPYWSLVTRAFRLLLAWFCLLSPWLALASTEMLLLERNTSAEERDASAEEVDDAALSGTRRSAQRKAAGPGRPPTPIDSPPFAAGVSKAAPPAEARAWYRPHPKVRLRRVLPQGEDPFSRNNA